MSLFLRIRAMTPLLLFGVLNSEMAKAGNPQIVVDKGECSIIANLVNEQCQSKSSNSPHPAYQRFVINHFNLISQMYNQERGSCSALYNNVYRACEDDCDGEDCLWVLVSQNKNANPNNPQNAQNQKSETDNFSRVETQGLTNMPAHLFKDSPSVDSTASDQSASLSRNGQLMNTNSAYAPPVYILGVPKPRK